MRVGIFHNHYVWRGGEDGVVALEVELLRKAGVEVQLFTVDNRDAKLGSLAGRLRVGLRARRSRACGPPRRGVPRARTRSTWPTCTTSSRCSRPPCTRLLHARGIPVVQTLHNYRLYCANGAFLREGRPCEDCVAAGPVERGASRLLPGLARADGGLGRGDRASAPPAHASSAA